MDVEFRDLEYSAKTGFRARKKKILNGISGTFHQGQLCAILGPSGAGKTTLLNAVSGYKTVGVEGDLKINGEIRVEDTFRRRSCYITQEDLLPQLMTVKEAMMMAAQLKLPRTIERKSKSAIIYDIISNLGLEEQMSTRTEHLSGGQKKRLSIALELLNNPPVFFLDEPTSGLDNVSALTCIKLLKRLATEGRTIICTIHQPPDSLFQLFDLVYVVAKGYCVYQGTPQDIVPFLSKVGFECPLNYSPADYLIELTDGDSISNIEMLATETRNGKAYKNRIEHKPTETNGVNISKSEKDLLMQEEKQNWLKLKSVSLETKLRYSTPSWFQFWIILQRLLVQTFRNKTALIIQALHCCTCGFALGAVYYQSANDGAQMYNHLKFIVGVTLFFSHTHLMIPVLLFPTEVKLVKKEHFNRWYGLTPYFLATTLAKMPTQIIVNSVYTTIVYIMSGLPLEMNRYIMFIVIGNAVSFASEGMGIAIGATFNVINGSVLGPTLTAPFLGLAIYGFDFAKQINWAMRLIMKTSPMRCGVVALCLAVFGFGRPRLACNDIYCHFDDPKVLLEFIDIQSDVLFYGELLALVGIIVFYRILAYLSIRRRFAT